MTAMVFSWPSAAQDASPRSGLPPPNGVDLIATGSALAAFGVASYATAPICKTSVVVAQEQSSCFEVSLIVGAPFLAAGISLFVVGAMQHARYAAWMRSHPAFFGLSIAPTGGGSLLGWGARF
jgi:hypothetical protein